MSLIGNHRFLSAVVLSLATAACASDSADASAETDASSTAAEPETETDGPAAQTFDACDDTFERVEPNPNYAWTPNAIQLVSEELADGVFAVYDANSDAYGPQGVPLATSGGFVIGDDGVALVETMINRSLFCQVIDLVRAETDKPVLYAINTSYHGDHSYGNAFLPDDVIVVQHERTAAYIADNFDADVAFMEMNFGADQGIDEVVPVVPDVAVTDAGWSADLGGITVAAEYYGFAQTNGDLFISVPEAGVLWTGNPLVSEAPAIPWLLDGQAASVASTLATVRDALSSAAIVVPGHGRPQSADAFDFSVDYLDALLLGTQAAVDEGMTAEEAVETVSLPDFQGYALWGWVHNVINVPNTYAELAP